MNKPTKTDEEKLIDQILSVDSHEFHLRLNDVLIQKRVQMIDHFTSVFQSALDDLRKFKTDDQIAREFLTLPRAGRKPTNHTLPLN